MPDLKVGTKEKEYCVENMHCPSCEILVEKNLLSAKGVKSVKASLKERKVRILFSDKVPNISYLNSFLEKDGYALAENKSINKKRDGDWWVVLLTVLLAVALLFLLGKSFIVSLVDVNLSSSILSFFFLGLVAGISSCAALVGSVLLSVSKSWFATYDGSSIGNKLKPYVMFNLGRLLSFSFLGGLIAVIGSKIQFSPPFSSTLVILISLLMIFLALDMLGVRTFAGIKIALPKNWLVHIFRGDKKINHLTPLLMGGLTFFLPCGFTLTVQSLALLSREFWKGFLIMGSFAAGTLPGLLLIGFSSVKFLERKNLSLVFSRVAGILVLLFAIYNINAQFNILGFYNLADIKNSFAHKDEESGFVPLVAGKQIVHIKASNYGYTPNYFKVRPKIPVVIELEDNGASGCTGAIVSRDLFEGEIQVIKDNINSKEFMPPSTPGKYKFTCWMGMFSGIIEVAAN